MAPEEQYLEHYDGQSIEELIALESSHSTDSIIMVIEGELDRRKGIGSSLSEAELNILAVEAFNRELSNGGFIQFFSNSSLEYSPIIVQALLDTGCTRFAELAQAAIDALAIDPNDFDAIEDRALSEDEELEDKLSSLDDQFYDVEECCYEGLFRYIKANKNSILQGSVE